MIRTISLFALLCLIFSCDEQNSEMYETPVPIEYGTTNIGIDDIAVEEVGWNDEASGEIAGTTTDHNTVLLNITDATGYANSTDNFSISTNNINSASGLKSDLSQKLTHEQTKARAKPKTKAKIIWSGGLEYQVNNVDSSTIVIAEIAALNEGYVSEMNKSQTNKRINNSITLKVLSENFQKTMKELKELSIHLNNETIKSQDVSKEYIDAESRLKTKQEVLERYKDILRTRTGKIEEVLDAEEKIRKLTEEIEAKKGYLRYLGDRVKYSRINLSIYEKVEFESDEPVRYEKTFGDKALAGFGNGWSIIQNLALVLITLWPLLLIVTIVLFWKRKWIKKTFRTAK